MLYADTGKTFEELQIMLGERIGLLDHSGSTAAIPSDQALQDKLKRFVNNGYHTFVRSNPKWRFMRPQVELTLDPNGTGPYNIDGDAGLYLLPLGITGPPAQPFAYGTSEAWYEAIKVVPWDALLRMKVANPSFTGTPYMCAFAAHDPGEGDVGHGRRRWKVQFYPKPSTAYVVTAPFRLNLVDLLEPNDRHVAGSEHDMAILKAALWEWHVYDDEAGDAAAKAERDWTAELARSIALDAQHASQTVGKMHDPTQQKPRDYRDATYRGVTKVSGIDVQ